MATQATSPPPGRRRGNTASSVAQSVTSTAENLLSQDAPLSFWAAAGVSASQAPNLLDIRRGSFGTEGWQGNEQQVERRRRVSSLRSSTESRPPRAVPEETVQVKGSEPFPALEEEEVGLDEPLGAIPQRPPVGPAPAATVGEEYVDDKHYSETAPVSRDHRALSSGWIPPPPALPWTVSMWIGFKAFLKWAATPVGFFITIYALNVVAWGGMLFLLLCNASPAMCWAPIHTEAADLRRTPVDALQFVSTQPRFFDCNDINSPRRIWLEIDSQILNALFCVTGFGLVPWRFRDLYYLLRYRFTSARRSGLSRKLYGLRVLAGIHRTWFRLPGSPTIDEMSPAEYERAVAKSAESPADFSLEAALHGDIRTPLPLAKQPSDPLTGVRAPATPTWKLDFFVWCNVWNTLFQIVLCVFMWHLDRYDRPSWATGLFIALACIIAGAGGIVSFVEGKRVKRVEGVQAKNVSPPRHTGLQPMPTQHEEAQARVMKS